MSACGLSTKYLLCFKTSFTLPYETVACLMKLTTDEANGTLDSLLSTEIISSVSRPTETAAYRECVVMRYSWMKLGRLTGSAMVTRKSCACSDNGDKLSRNILPSRGLIQMGLAAWSGFNFRYEKSALPKTDETESGTKSGGLLSEIVTSSDSSNLMSPFVLLILRIASFASWAFFSSWRSFFLDRIVCLLNS
ncbi:hypothetical protein OGAPHI_006126 [Ogataea philodendri]|uniref:Uncharacterized protein n=1 Tax=Ogataea philodendri TaxID=1378263 RepID=A0A9P8NZ92_9ASCO|nr:uncharacterized protein OGAPHI_006126 [Ogataea philodendri]KAH3661947.1 hypothetical protein OGAPHI_006126 [Ogataea philodendri]